MSSKAVRIFQRQDGKYQIGDYTVWFEGRILHIVDDELVSTPKTIIRDMRFCQRLITALQRFEKRKFGQVLHKWKLRDIRIDGEQS